MAGAVSVLAPVSYTHLCKVVASLRIIAPELPFAIDCLERTEPEQTIHMDGFRIEAFKVNHNAVSYTHLAQHPYYGW